jgi:hypothetical protein
VEEVDMSDRAKHCARYGWCGLVVVQLLSGCSEPPTVADPGQPLFAKPAQCNVDVDLRITMAEGLGGTQAIRGDDLANTPYEEGVDQVGAHLSGVNGNLMLSVLNSPNRRFAWSSSAGSGLSDDRLYTNSHDNPGGTDACGLAGMVNGSSGSAAFEAELLAGATNGGIVRYGKTCSGSADATTRVVTTRSSDGLTWTITGTSGVHCEKGPKNKLVQVGTSGFFSMTLVKIN